MRNLFLEEYGEIDAELESKEVRLLLNLRPFVNVVPTMDEGIYRIVASSYVGFAHVTNDLTLQVSPKVPIKNLFLMLSTVYSPDQKIFQDHSQDYRTFEDLFEFVVKVFIKHTENIVTRGLYKKYQKHEERLVAIKGEINFPKTVTSRPGLHDQHWCVYSRFTTDIEENRILKWAAYQLRRLRFQERSLSSRLHRVFQLMRDVQLVEVSYNTFNQINFNRLNQLYKPALNLARLLLNHLSFTGTRGKHRFLTYQVDMNWLFEKYIGEMMRPLVNRDNLRLVEQDRHALDKNRNFTIRPDFVVYHDMKPVLVMDTKYKKKQSVNDIYQLISYCQVLNLQSACLIYPGKSKPSVQEVRGRNAIYVRHHFIDLSLDKSQIDAQIQNLYQQLAESKIDRISN